MKYIKQYKDGSDPFEITEDEARERLTEAYGETEAENILVTPGDYNLLASYITVKED